MKRTVAFALAALLACLCLSACGGKTPGPEKSDALLTLYTDTRPLRIVTQERGVTVTLQLLEYEPTLGFLRRAADEWEETLEPGREYTIDKELAEGIPQYRLYARKENLTAVHDLVYDGKIGGRAVEIKGRPWAPAPIDETSPMVHLSRTAAIVPPGDDEYTYWYAIANAISALRAVDLALEPDELVPRAYDPDDPMGFYLVPGWLFEAYAFALFPGTQVPPLGDYNLWAQYHPENHERYRVGQAAYADHCEAKFKRAKQNGDGTWDVSFAVRYVHTGEAQEKTVRLAPNEAYNPDSPFEYHIAGWPEAAYGDDEPAVPAVPPPEILVGKWRAPVKPGHAAWLEIFEDGMAGLYLGDDKSDQLYETYHGTVSPADDTDIEGTGVDYLMEMDFRLDWHIYETGDGSPVTGVPDSYSGVYTLRHEWEGGQQVLYVSTVEGGNLFEKKELRMLWAA